MLDPASLKNDLQPKYAAIGTKSIFLNLESVEGMYRSIDDLGKIFGRGEQAQALIDEYNRFMAEYNKKNEGKAGCACTDGLSRLIQCGDGKQLYGFACKACQRK